jgi:NAD(P)H dehydrogenase (quinone)
MKHAVILAHPKPDSFCASMANRYATAIREMDQEVIVRDLYGMKFDPCLKAEEIPTPDGYGTGADVGAERKLLDGVDVFAFVYPFWFNAPPAILKGYVDRVFGMGFGYEPITGGTTGLLYGRRLISFTSSGAPEDWVRHTGAMAALHTLFDKHLTDVTGMTIADHVHFGGITHVLTEEWVEKMLRDVRAAARRAFLPREVALP